FRLPGVTFFCISDTLVPTTYLVDTTLSNSSDSDQTVQAVRLLFMKPFTELSFHDAVSLMIDVN
ncbi:hypothetical protein KX485_22050, partial [Escherichia coli]|nr:hypothetical protein [Escherichia coli]MCD3752933.1 hypothetical protein [Escherichia coli]MCD3820465.1 hypothetical protein [Escherichia coli]MCD3825749.1 hypothetical protein [Escherichia coli]MCD3856946.1 hypothetical protein [Escherichia coli]